MKIVVFCIHTEHTRNVNKVDYVDEFKFRTTVNALLVFKSPFYFKGKIPPFSATVSLIPF